MEKYLGVKIVSAEPMPQGAEWAERHNGVSCCAPGKDKEGYKVIYEDGYQSWSPKEVFEKAYKEIDPTPHDRIGLLLDPRNGKWDFVGHIASIALPGEDLPEGANAALDEAAKNMARTLPLEFITPLSQPPYSLSREEVLREKALEKAVAASLGGSSELIMSRADAFYKFLSGS